MSLCASNGDTHSHAGDVSYCCDVMQSAAAARCGTTESLTARRCLRAVPPWDCDTSSSPDTLTLERQHHRQKQASYRRELQQQVSLSLSLSLVVVVHAASWLAGCMQPIYVIAVNFIFQQNTRCSTCLYFQLEHGQQQLCMSRTRT